ncbi:MAG TPA: hypothetical protein VKU00_25575, partial [Chthonomonadaceae bacterium]|nr:hypothetical protein [Chthonomonadaceae bacterium]
EAQLSASIATPSPYSGQRYLTLRMKVSGGEIANPNVDVGNNLISSFGNGTIFTRRNGQTTITSVNPTSGTAVNGLGPLSLTDPYGIELIPSGQYLVPSEEKSAHLETSDGKEIIWSVGVNGAGRGTDVIRLQFAVRPTASAAAAADTPQNLVPFDLLVPVQTGNEI